MIERHGPLPVENFWYGREGATLDRIIIHTMVGWISSADARFHDASSWVSAHYGVRMDGTVWQWVADEDIAYHAGDWIYNTRAIGIEHEDGGNFNGPRPDALYTASAALVRDICGRYDIPIDRDHIKGHREVHATACPDALDINRIVREAVGGSDMTDDELRAALKRVYAGPDSLEEWVKVDVRLMLERDAESRAAIVGAVKEKLA